MKKIALAIMTMSLCLTAAAQPGAPENVILTRRSATTISYGGPTVAEGRSYNFTPIFYIYPDTKLDKAGAEQLLSDLEIQSCLDANYGTAIVVNPTGDKYTEADFEIFVKLFNQHRGPGNLKVLGLGKGATFVNQVIAPKAGDHIAGILTVGGKAGKTVHPAGVPTYVAGKGAAKAAKPYQQAISAHADEPLLQVVVNPAEAPLNEVFADAWKQVLGRNYRYNNYKHTYYEGSPFGQYGAGELEPYLDCEALGIQRVIVEQPVGMRGPQTQDAPKWLWYEYWPKELMNGAPEHSVPVVVLLHGNTNDPRTQAETSGFIQVAAEERFFVVEMEWQGTPNYQAMGHDGVESVLYQLFAKFPQLDPSRVYAEGLSAGSMTATALGIKKSHLFTAVGGHSGGLFGGIGMGAFPGFTSIWNEATQKRGAVEMPYCSVLGTADKVVPYMTPDNWKGNGYLNAWNAYEQMNGMEVNDQMDFTVDPVFGQKLEDRETIVTNKGEGIVIETGQLYKGNVPLIKIVAVMDYGHWNFQPTARIMWDFFKQYRRDPETKQIIYNGTMNTPNPENALRAQQFLKKAGTYYLATVDGKQPRVRPFGTAEIFEGKLYIQTGKVKNVYKQLEANPKAEICAFVDGEWIRIAGQLIPDERVEAKKAMLDKNPSLRGMYNENDDNTIVLYFRNATATISSFTHEPETFCF